MLVCCSRLLCLYSAAVLDVGRCCHRGCWLASWVLCNHVILFLSSFLFLLNPILGLWEDFVLQCSLHNEEIWITSFCHALAGAANSLTGDHKEQHSL